jgi:hypothetical protein
MDHYDGIANEQEPEPLFDLQKENFKIGLINGNED